MPIAIGFLSQTLPVWHVLLLTPFGGAFWGASLGMVAYQVNEGLRRLREHQREHHTALVTLEHGLNAQMESIGTTIDAMRGFLTAVTNGARPIIMPHEVVDHGVDVVELMEPILMSQLRTTGTGVARLHRAITSLNRAYELTCEQAMSHPESKQLREAISAFAGPYREVLGHAIAIQASIQRCFARVRIQCPMDKPGAVVLELSAYQASAEQVEEEYLNFLKELANQETTEDLARHFREYRLRVAKRKAARLKYRLMHFGRDQRASRVF